MTASRSRRGRSRLDTPAAHHPALNKHISPSCRVCGTQARQAWTLSKHESEVNFLALSKHKCRGRRAGGNGHASLPFRSLSKILATSGALSKNIWHWQMFTQSGCSTSSHSLINSRKTWTARAKSALPNSPFAGYVLSSKLEPETLTIPAFPRG